MARLLFLALSSLVISSVADSSYIVEFTVQLESTVEKFELTVHPDWAPIGAARFRELVDINFFNRCVCKKSSVMVCLLVDTVILSLWPIILHVPYFS